MGSQADTDPGRSWQEGQDPWILKDALASSLALHPGTVAPVSPRGPKPPWLLSALEEVAPHTQGPVVGPSLWPLRSSRVWQLD